MQSGTLRPARACLPDSTYAGVLPFRRILRPLSGRGLVPLTRICRGRLPQGPMEQNRYHVDENAYVFRFLSVSIPRSPVKENVLGGRTPENSLEARENRKSAPSHSAFHSVLPPRIFVPLVKPAKLKPGKMRLLLSHPCILKPDGNYVRSRLCVEESPIKRPSVKLGATDLGTIQGTRSAWVLMPTDSQCLGANWYQRIT